MTSYDLAIIGGASLDVLHVNGHAHRSPGGAGLYTSLAANWMGARPLMVAPLPEPVPAELTFVRERIGWIGPVVPPEELPSFELEQTADGHSRMRRGFWGAEARLSPADLPPEGIDAPLVYCGPLANPETQLAFLRHFQSAGHRTACGTYKKAVTEHNATVRETLRVADIFFCNEEEARLLFGTLDAATTQPGKLLFVTLGGEGVLVAQGAHQTHVPGRAVEAVDTTGAGDTFCGATLALLARGVHPVLAAQQAVACAGEMVQGVGPSRLRASASPPALMEDARVAVNALQVERVAFVIASAAEVEPFPFVGDLFPPVGHPATLDYFFTSTLQQFGFWSEEQGRYREPFIAPIGGRSLKGSDFMWAVYRRWLDKQPDELRPLGQANVTSERFNEIYTDDLGQARMPLLLEHFALARSYGRDMSTLGWTPETIVAEANASETPLRTFLTMLDHVGGYKEDPLRKKAILLAIVLQQRPERFLRSDPTEQVPPIIDYHLQRSCLRTGLIEVRDAALAATLSERRVLDAGAEWAVRMATYRAIEEVQARSGKSMGAVDWFFFGARRRCPEMTEPQCDLCAVEPACVKAKALFQPVFRTTFY